MIILGRKMLKLLKNIKKEFGQSVFYKLVIKTKITEDVAKKIDDSEDNFKIVITALNEIGYDIEV